MLKYIESTDGISCRHLDQGFFENWKNPVSPEMHLEILRGSSHVVLAVDEATDKVVGFVTAFSDGVLSAYIPLLEVLPTYRGRRIGSELVRRMLERLKHLNMVDLTCDEHLTRFYERFGMQRSSAMVIRRYLVDQN